MPPVGPWCPVKGDSEAAVMDVMEPLFPAGEGGERRRWLSILESQIRSEDTLQLKRDSKAQELPSLDVLAS